MPLNRDRGSVGANVGPGPREGAEGDVRGPTTSEFGAAAVVRAHVAQRRIDVDRCRPSAVGADSLLRLQRSVGNRAVADVVRPVVQRALAHAGFQPDAGDQLRLTELTTLIGEYNALCTGDQAEQAAGLQARFQKLWSIDTKIHAWFTAKQAPDLLTVKNGTEMKALLLETERERDVVVGKLVRAGAPLPMAGLGATENRGRLEALWTRISGGTEGKLKVRGSDADKTQLLGRLAAIMQTPTGRALLTFVAEHSPKAIELMFADVAPPAEGQGSMPSAYAAKLTGADAGERVAPPRGTELSTQDKTLAAELA